tara:strand:+ start:1166 stop:2338 length:1173 start_codon:yes stop_codon:yes gene_type:complete
MSDSPKEAPIAPDPPLWASEPFRVFFPLGLLAAAFGLLLWPMYYAGWWDTYPALQHPRLLILGFGSAFVIGFLGTAWPRFVEAPPLGVGAVLGMAALWMSTQVCYAFGPLHIADGLAALTFLAFLGVLASKLFGKDRDQPPLALLIPFLNLGLVSTILLCWSLGVKAQSPQWQTLFRLLVYQGFLLLPLLGVGSFFFPKFFDAAPARSKRKVIVLLATVALILGSFFLEAWGEVRVGNGIRLFALGLWSWGAVPMIWRGKAPGTRAWSLRMALVMIATGFACRLIWPHQVFAFEHLLFLGGFSQIMLLVADRVAVGHSDGHETTPPRSLRWRWIVWIMVLTAATRATADLVPSTRVSHHIYAAIMLTVVLILWWTENGGRLRRGEESEDS